MNPLTKLLSVKVVAWSLAAVVTGGAAAAAGTVAFSSSSPSSTPSASVNANAGGTSVSGGGSVSAKGGGVTSTKDVQPAKLCNTLATKVESQVSNAEGQADSAVGSTLSAANL